MNIQDVIECLAHKERIYSGGEYRAMLAQMVALLSIYELRDNHELSFPLSGHYKVLSALAIRNQVK